MGIWMSKTTISELPYCCISKIISLTSPLDACVVSSVSHSFHFIADSDEIWSRFLPSDYSEVIAKSVFQLIVPTNKKQLYAFLSGFPILIDEGRLSFLLHKQTGKKSFMVGARQLSISWGDTPLHWKWTTDHDSIFYEVVELRRVYWLDIKGKLNTQMLSRDTTYETYLTYKLTDKSKGLDYAKASIRLVSKVEDVPSHECITVYLQPGGSVPNAELCRKRKDGWLEIKTGEFINAGGDEGEVETRIMEIEQLHCKIGLIVHGIEFRPKNN